MSYTPRPGSHPARAIAALRNGPMTREQMAKALGKRPENVDAALTTPIQYGLIVRTRINGLGHFQLPERTDRLIEARAADGGGECDQNVQADAQAAEPAVDTFSARLYDDGEIEIFGAMEIEQGELQGFRLTREQLARVVLLVSGGVVEL